jgi:RHS repeat-associated protein
MNVVQTQGTCNTPSQGCRSQFTFSYTFQAGYRIQAGDKLYISQYVATPGASAGPALDYTDQNGNLVYGDTISNVFDLDGCPMNQDCASFTANAWHFRRLDLTPLAGGTFTGDAFVETVSTTNPNTIWAVSYMDFVVVGADGTVYPIFTGVPNGSTLNLSTWNQPGASGLSDSTGLNCPICVFGIYYYHGDQIGSSRLLTSGAGWPVWQGTFLPFGEEYSPQLTTNHYRFSGKERDSESGLDYFGARYNSSTLSRFLTPDKPFADQHIREPQSWNLYSYARNNPLKYIDTDGRKVQVADQTALNQIRQTLPPNVRSHVVTDKNGFISAKGLAGVRSGDANFQTLRHMVNATGTVEVSTGTSTQNARGETFSFQYKSDAAVKAEQQAAGIVTINPSPDSSLNKTGITYAANESMSGNIEVHVSNGTGEASTVLGVELAVTMGHELYVHGANLLEGKPAEHEDTPNGPVNKQTKEVEERTRKNAEEPK